MNSTTNTAKLKTILPGWQNTRKTSSAKLFFCKISSSKQGLYLCLLFSCLFVSGFSHRLSAQGQSYLYQVNAYPFIRSDQNQLHFPGGYKNADHFYSKLEQLLTTGEGKINIVQIGGSHIQAGYFSGRLRERFQTMNGEMNAGWGYMFPYHMARTNSPFGYYIRYSGQWRTTRNVERKKHAPLGLGGIAASTNSPEASLTILLEKGKRLDYRFNRLRIYYEDCTDSYQLQMDTALVRTQSKTDRYIDIELKQATDSLHLILRKKPNKTGTFTLHGIFAESRPNGILFHGIGVNGAHVPAFLRCQLLEEQLADLQPDLVILGLGINDAYGRTFSQKRFEAHYAELLKKIRNAAPQACIVFTTNNDSYLYRRYVNKNGLKVRESMFRMAQQYHAGVWDLFTVMGGLNSIVLWERNGLARSDKIHFTREGYLLLGDLFFAALMQDFENIRIKKNQPQPNIHSAADRFITNKSTTQLKQ